LEWAGLNLRTRKFADAVKRAEDGLKNVPGDASLKAMIVRARTLEGLTLSDEFQPMIDSLAQDPASEGGVATLAAIADSQTAHESADALSDRFATVADQNPRYLPVLVMLVSRDCNAGRYDRAARLAMRACESMPMEPEPARLLTLVLSTSRQWNAALSAATQWRNRTLDHPQNADLAIATAQLELHRPEPAIEQLFPYLSTSINQAATTADASSPATATVELYLKALCLADRADQAWAIAEPLAKQSPQWRRRWPRIISITAKTPTAGGEQLQQIEPLLAANSIEDQLARGEAWCTLGSRFNDTASLNKALSVVEPLTDGSPTPPDAWLVLGDIHQQLDELPEAEADFTKAVAAAPDSAIAKNNLATVIWLRNEDPHPARQLATAAVTASPLNSAMHTTLGEVDEELNDFDAASTQFEIAMRLDADNAEAVIGLASSHDRSGHDEQNSALLQQAQAIIQASNPRLPKPVQQELRRLLSPKHPAARAAVDAKN
jgi:tetratricopeptide (TPR) repeat protein